MSPRTETRWPATAPERADVTATRLSKPRCKFRAIDRGADPAPEKPHPGRPDLNVTSSQPHGSLAQVFPPAQNQARQSSLLLRRTWQAYRVSASPENPLASACGAGLPAYPYPAASQAVFPDATSPEPRPAFRGSSSSGYRSSVKPRCSDVCLIAACAIVAWIERTPQALAA